MKRRTFIYSFIKSIILAIILVFIINTWLFKPVEVVGSSMYPTLKDGQQGFSSVISLNLEGINRFDVVVVKTESDYLVKRVIGLPNETIEFKDDQLIIDSVVIEENYLNQGYVNEIKQQTEIFTNNFGPMTLDDNQYFLMGDNRMVSVDSRYSQYGPFEKEAIISKYIIVLYPFDQIHWVGEVR